MEIYQVIKEPHITEKANLLKKDSNQISLKVHRKANKVDIRRAVETLFGKEVLEVRTLSMRGKRRRMGRNVGKRSDWKKAIVRLAMGEQIEIFEGM